MREWRKGNKEGRGGKKPRKFSIHQYLLCERGEEEKSIHLLLIQTDGYTIKELRSNSVEIDGKARSSKGFLIYISLVAFFFLNHTNNLQKQKILTLPFVLKSKLILTGHLHRLDKTTYVKHFTQYLPFPI